MMASGSLAATSSISMPPAAEAMNTLRPLVRSSTMPRYSSRAMGSVSSIEQALDLLALGTGLMRDQLHAQHLVGEIGSFFRRLGDLHAAAFAAASGMNLRFHDDAGGAIAEQSARRVMRLFAALHHLSSRHGNAVLRQDGLSLVLMYFHICRMATGDGPRLRPDWPDSSAPCEDRATVGNPLV